ncbi:hypothetical protein D9M68_772160 [compost metagenome]
MRGAGRQAQRVDLVLHHQLADVLRVALHRVAVVQRAPHQLVAPEQALALHARQVGVDAVLHVAPGLAERPAQRQRLPHHDLVGAARQAKAQEEQRREPAVDHCRVVLAGVAGRGAA